MPELFNAIPYYSFLSGAGLAFNVGYALKESFSLSLGGQIGYDYIDHFPGLGFDYNGVLFSGFSFGLSL
jgi:hypothetical protein